MWPCLHSGACNSALKVLWVHVSKGRLTAPPLALRPPPSILRRDADTEVERIVKLERHYYAVLKVGGADLLGEKQIASRCRGRCQAILRGGELG